jgi:hypothetical protein
MEYRRPSWLQVIADWDTASRLAHSGGIVGISSKEANILLHPVESNLLIGESEFAAALVANLLQVTTDHFSGQESANTDVVFEVHIDGGVADRYAVWDWVDWIEDWKVGSAI